MLNVDRVMRTSYTIDDLQTYFVIESFQDLYRKQSIEILTLFIRIRKGFLMPTPP